MARRERRVARGIEVGEQAAALDREDLVENYLDLLRALLRAEDCFVETEPRGAPVIETDFELGHACWRRNALPIT